MIQLVYVTSTSQASQNISPSEPSFKLFARSTVSKSNGKVHMSEPGVKKN
jgi:hypothetical protein